MRTGPGDSAPLLELSDIHVGYGKTAALHGVSLVVRPGETVALIGANGAGKSTTLRAISGLLKPTRGNIRFGGRDIGGMPPDRIVGLGIAHCPEERHVWPAMTVYENLVLGAYLCRSQATVQERVAKVYERFPRLKERHQQLAGTLSGGEQQMLAIGRILRTGAKMLLLDEPTEGLAPVIIQQIGRTIARLKNEGFTIVLVEQNFRFASTVADRHYVVEQGRVIDEIANNELEANLEKLHAYLGV